VRSASNKNGQKTLHLFYDQYFLVRVLVKITDASVQTSVKQT